MTNFIIKYSLITIIISLSQISYAQIPCVNGKSGEYDCDKVTFYSNVTAKELLAENTDGIWLNDIWGWVDPDTQKEYAIVALSNGTTFVDVSDPLNPIVLGILPEHGSASSGGRFAKSNSVWRDVKVFKNHAFIVSESSDHGMQVFDLTNLRNVENQPAVFPETAHYDGISNAHNIAINESTGFAYALGATRGTNCNGGELHIININDPVKPVYAACFDSNSYTHDAQCIIYDGPDTDYSGQEICFNSNESTTKIVNVTNKSSSSVISSFSHDNTQYAHQGWLTDDRKYYISNDELDELNIGTKTRTFIWDVQDLDQPVLLSTYTHGGASIDHNLYCKDTLVYQSNYTAGLRILNLKNIATTGLEEVAFFDTYPANNGISFQGNWSNYPYLPSGNIIVSDISNGLFILKYDPNYKEEEEPVIASIKDVLQATKVYPNPAQKFITIELAESFSNTFQVELYDLSGQLIIKSAFDSKYEKEATINSSTLKKGIYQLRISNNQGSIFRKILID